MQVLQNRIEIIDNSGFKKWIPVIYSLYISQMAVSIESSIIFTRAIGGFLPYTYVANYSTSNNSDLLQTNVKVKL
jgi:hypothetical protein